LLYEKKETFYMFLWHRLAHRFSIIVDSSRKNTVYSERDIITSYIFYMKKIACWVFYQTILFRIARSLSVGYSDKKFFSRWKAKLERLMVFNKIIFCSTILIPNVKLHFNEQLYIYCAWKRRKWITKRLRQIFWIKTNVAKVAEEFSDDSCGFRKTYAIKLFDRFLH
jgi:hypothetical protein